jgi:hypothetical protein
MACRLQIQTKPAIQGFYRIRAAQRQKIQRSMKRAPLLSVEAIMAGLHLLVEKLNPSAL